MGMRIAGGRAVRRARLARRVSWSAAVVVWAIIPVAAARATTILAMDFDAQCAAADRIFVGEVTSVESRRNDASPRYFQTIVTFRVEDVIAGNVPATIALRFAGGTIGDEQQSIDGMHQFLAGERYVVFTDPGADQPLLSPILGFNQGLYRVVETADANGSHRVVRDRMGGPLSSVPGISGTPAASLATGATGTGEERDLGAFVAAIRAARSR